MFIITFHYNYPKDKIQTKSCYAGFRFLKSARNAPVDRPPLALI
jgi:hypothetical protein